MRLRMLGLTFGLVFLAAPAAAQTADVLGPARQGQLQCFEPNVAAKTCQSLGSYTFNANGAIDNSADVLLMPSPAIVMRASSPVMIENNAICGPLRAEDIERATFTINGASANAEETAQLRAAMREQLAPMFGVQTCLTLTAEGEGFRANSTIGGTPRPELSQRAIWVGPSDGYRVAP